MEDKAAIEVVRVEVQDQSCRVEEGLLVDDETHSVAIKDAVELGWFVVDREVVGQPTAATTLHGDPQPHFGVEILLRED